MKVIVRCVPKAEIGCWKGNRARFSVGRKIEFRVLGRAAALLVHPAYINSGHTPRRAEQTV